MASSVKRVSDNKKSNEFRRYRQVLATIYIGTITAGIGLLAVSVVAELFFPPRVVVERRPLSPDNPDPKELLRCNLDVSSLLADLGSQTRALLRLPTKSRRARIDQSWKEFGELWRQKWHEVDQRCRFSDLSGAQMGSAYVRMARVHSDLPAIRLKYQSLLVRFDEELADELRQMKAALKKSRKVYESLAPEAPNARHRITNQESQKNGQRNDPPGGRASQRSDRSNRAE